MAATYAQAAYVAACEINGIPSVEILFSDQLSQYNQVGLSMGEPQIRSVIGPRVGQGPERVAQIWDQIIAALTDPLTDKEKETGLYVPPPDPRICFTGTLLDAQEFFQKTAPSAACKNCPLAQWTDGLPVIIPTEARVKEMLTGTSHPAEQYIAYATTGTTTYSSSGITVSVTAGDPMRYLPSLWGTTIEKVAVNCVMSGCEPSAMPILLAAFSTGSAFVTTNCPAAYYLQISGPIVKEVGLNVKDPYQVGVPSNMAIGRAYDMIFYNIGGALQGSANTNLGNPTNRTGVAIGEDADSLPPGWNPDNVEANRTPSQSIVKVYANVFSSGGWVVSNWAPQAFTDLNQGKGPIARYLGVEGKPGKYNILDFLVPQFIGAQAAQSGMAGWILSPDIAQSLYDYGFKKKSDIGAYLNNVVTVTNGEYKKFGWWDFNTNGGTSSISGTGLTYNTAPDSYLLHRMTSASIIVSNSVSQGVMIFYGSSASTKDIDPWR